MANSSATPCCRRRGGCFVVTLLRQTPWCRRKGVTLRGYTSLMDPSSSSSGLVGGGAPRAGDDQPGEYADATSKHAVTIFEYTAIPFLVL